MVPMGSGGSDGVLTGELQPVFDHGRVSYPAQQAGSCLCSGLAVALTCLLG